MNSSAIIAAIPRPPTRFSPLTPLRNPAPIFSPAVRAVFAALPPSFSISVDKPATAVLLSLPNFAIQPPAMALRRTTSAAANAST